MRDIDAASARVAHRVGQRFLRDADDFAFDAVAEAGKFVQHHVDGHAGRALTEIRKAFDRGRDVCRRQRWDVAPNRPSCSARWVRADRLQPRYLMRPALPGGRALLAWSCIRIAANLAPGCRGCRGRAGRSSRIALRRSSTRFNSPTGCDGAPTPPGAQSLQAGRPATPIALTSASWRQSSIPTCERPVERRRDCRIRAFTPTELPEHFRQARIVAAVLIVSLQPGVKANR